ncbi:MAG: ATP-dependent metalloprotease FtsH, partial [Chloroflexi bacterium]|nr:ATP-dependent metalloprotease FtsH [Chloroflexota bacterium]
MNGKFFRNGILMLVLVVGTVALLYTFLMSPSPDATKAYSDFLGNVSAGQVQEVTQQDLVLTVKPTSGTQYQVIVPGVGMQDVYADVRAAAQAGGKNPADITFRAIKPSETGQWISLLVGALLPVLLIGGFIFLMMRQAQGTNNQALSFGKSRARMFLGNKTVV